MRKVYGENNSDNSDYGELRAIVRRIEMNQKESAATNLPQSTTNSDNNNQQVLTPTVAAADKKLVFDYIPASVMMKK